MDKGDNWQRAISILTEENNRRRLAIFLGAGCSFAAGLPSWKQLIDELLAHYKIKTNETNLIRLASRLERDVGVLAFREEVCNRLRSRPDFSTTLHDILVSLEIRLFVTTNYDHILEDAFRKQGYAPRIVFNDIDIPTIDLTRQTIVKLHGDIDSPTSLIITSFDYTTYQSSHLRFVEWFTNLATQNTLLFLGTSFDDPRLKEIDDHVLRLYDKNRRQPFILLKSPETSGKSEDQLAIELGDFQALCAEFTERGFFLILIDNYDDIPIFLNELHKNVLKKKITERPSDSETKLIIQTDHINRLEQTASNLLDDITKRLCDDVSGNGRQPTPVVMIQRVETLIQHLEHPPYKLSPQAQMEGWLTAVDSLLNAGPNDQIIQARQYYEKAISLFQEISEPEKWQERLLRVRAKLLFFEGKSEEAVDSLMQSDDPKTISLRLALLLDSNRLTEAYDFVSSHPVNPAWACTAMYALIFSNQIIRAEDLFRQTMNEFESFQSQGDIADSPFEHQSFVEKIYFVAAHAFYVQVLRLLGKSESTPIFPKDLVGEAKSLIQKSLDYLDHLFSYLPSHNLTENYIATQATLLTMQISFLLQKWEKARDAARSLINVKPIKQEVVNYILGNAQESFSQDDIDKVRMRLESDHPLESWAWLSIAIIEAYYLKNYEKSWIAIKKSLELATSQQEKTSSAKMIFDIGQDLYRLDEAMSLIDDALPPDDLWHHFFHAWQNYLQNNPEEAERLLAEIETHNPPLELIGRVKLLYAQQAIRKERWKEARQLLEESCQAFYTPLALKELLFILTKIQDDPQALRIAEEIESLGIIDWQVIDVKAQAARNLGFYRKSAEALQRIVDQFPERPEYAYNLAAMRFQLNEQKEAIKVLDKFIQCDDKTNSDCLFLAVSIYEAIDDDKTAFELLGRCQDQITNCPNLLLKYLELGYRIDKEKEAHWALMRLEILRQEGKVPEETFSRVPFEKLIEILKERRENFDKINNSYRLGQIPRLMLCSYKNIPIYLDWAVRTQELQLPGDPNQWIDFTTYATNSLRVEFTPKMGNQLTIITAPADDDIVIDYHALITLHRLNLLNRLEKRYSNIFYPRSLKDLMAAELRRFGHHQLSEEKAFRSLNDKLLIGQIREFTAPDPSDEIDRRQDSLTKRNLRLAQLEKIPIIDSYLENSELKGFEDVRVVRLSQLVSWLYGKGKLSQKQFTELKDLSAGDREPISRDINAFMDDEPRLLIAETTIKIAEKYSLLQLLSEVGCQVIIERATANVFRFAVRELDFGQKVSTWHKDLMESLSKMRVFQEINPQIPTEYKRDFRDQYFESAAASLIYAEQTGLPLLTDDRFTQMIRTRKLVNRQFGTDSLLKEFYEKGIITLSEYANCFLKLCQWRYRFLIPDVQIMVFLAKEFRQKPLGKHLQTIADYGRECMEEPGLFLGPEPTEPPLPCGLKFQQQWIARWIDFLVVTWQDEDFSAEILEQLTQKVYLQALPEIPKLLNLEVRGRLASFNDTSVIKHLLINIMAGESDPLKLHGLFQQTFEVFGLDEKRITAELKAHLEFLQQFIDENIKDKGEKHDVRKAYYSRVLLAFMGKNISNQNIDPLLIPILNEAGLCRENKLLDDQVKTEPTLHELPDLISRQNLPEYSSKGPLIFIPPANEKPGKILIPHDLIMASSKEVRIETIKYLMNQYNLTHYTRRFLDQKRDDLLSSNIQVWLPAGKAVAEKLLDDFYYVKSLFIQLNRLPFPDEDLVNLAWKHILRPGLDSVLDNKPLLIDGPLDTYIIQERIKSGIITNFSQQTNNTKDNFTIILDWYLDNIYFIPLSVQLGPWEVIMEFYNRGSGNDATGKNLSLPGPSPLEIFHAVKSWISKKDDPLASLIALELVLNARSKVARDEEYEFIGDKFYDFINQLLEVLLITTGGDLPAINNTRFRKIRCLWHTRLMLTNYYLKYIDIHDKTKTLDEMKVVLSWWLAKEAISIISKSLEHQFLSDHDIINWIEDDIQTTIKYENYLLSITHLFVENQIKHSLSRYYTQNNRLILPTIVMALLNPKSSAFNGFIHPSIALSPDSRDLIINRIAQDSLEGSQLYQKDKNKLPLLWSVPLCVSGPYFLRSYYGDALEYIGSEKVGMIELAEDVSRPDFLADHLPRFSEYIEKKQITILAITIRLLRNYIDMNKTLPPELNVFAEDKTILKKLAALDELFAKSFLGNCALILKRLQIIGEHHWVKVFCNQFAQLDYTKYSDDVIEIVIPELIGVVLLGGDYSLMKNILDCKESDKRVRKILGKMKGWLVYGFPRVPDSYRENVRKVLNDLKDFPLRDREEKGNGIKSDE